MRIINFVDFAESATVPTIGNISASDLVTYATDAAFIADQADAPQRGNIYYNTTGDYIRYYDGTVWQTLISVENLSDLLDVTVTTPLDNQLLQYDSVGGQWINSSELPDRVTATEDLIVAVDAELDVHTAATSVHGVTGEVVGTTDTQDFSNKTFTDPITLTELVDTPTTPVSGDKKLYAKDNGKMYTLDSDGNETEIGSGSSGGGSKNYIDQQNADFEQEATVGDWSSDNGAGGSSVVLAALPVTNSAQVLSGTRSLRLAKTAAGAEGHFLKVGTTTIDRGDRGGPLFFSVMFDATQSTGYESGDLGFEFYDVTNSAVLYSGNTSDLEITKSQGFVNGVVYTEPTTQTVEVRIKQLTASAEEYNVFFDSFKLGPAASVQTIYRKSATIDLSADANFSAGEIQVERVGNIVTLHVTSAINYTSATSVTSAAAVLPDWATPSVDGYNLAYYTSALIYEIRPRNDGKLTLNTKNYSGTAAATTAFSVGTISYTVPEITGPTMTTNELGLQKLKVTGDTVSTASHTSDSNYQLVSFTTSSDNYSAYSSGVFTAPRTGWYYFSTLVRFGSSATGRRGVRISTTGTPSTIEGDLVQAGGTGVVGIGAQGMTYLLKGQTAQVEAFQSSGGSLAYNAAGNLTIVGQEDLTLIGAVKNHELIEDSNNTLQNWSITAGQYGDIDSIVLSAGEWDLDAILTFYSNGSTTTTTIQSGFGTASGNNAPTILPNAADTKANGTTTLTTQVPYARGVVVTTPTTYYLKGFAGTSITNLQYRYKISARRVK